MASYKCSSVMLQTHNMASRFQGHARMCRQVLRQKFLMAPRNLKGRHTTHVQHGSIIYV